MNESVVKDFLANYIQKTTLLFQTYFERKKQEAAITGNISVELLEKFARIAEKGKKIRGALLVLGYQLAGGKDLESIYDVSIFIEIFHAGALVHDDIMDNDDRRRGMPTIHRQLEKYGVENGRSLAILVGDMAFYLALDKLLNCNFSSDKIIVASKVYTKYALNVTYGQALDLLNNNKSKLNHQDILKVFRFKTAEYTGVLPLIIGATLAGENDKKRLEQLKEYGLSLGWAFQIQDDVLGLYGNTEKTGKSVESDLKEGKITLFIYYLLKHGSKKQKEFIFSILGNKNINQRDIKKTQSLFKDIGAYDYVTKLGWDYVKKGKKVVPEITKNKKLQNLLDSFIEYVMGRTR